MKKCPYCAELVQDEAIVCKHCGRELALHQVAAVSGDLERHVGAITPPEKASQQPTFGQPPNPFDQPDSDNDTETKPKRSAWKSAAVFGAVITGLVMCGVMVDPYSDFVGYNKIEIILWGFLPYFALWTVIGYALVRSCRWKKWAPFALIAAFFVATILIFLLAISDEFGVNAGNPNDSSASSSLLSVEQENHDLSMDIFRACVEREREKWLDENREKLKAQVIDGRYRLTDLGIEVSAGYAAIIICGR